MRVSKNFVSTAVWMLAASLLCMTLPAAGRQGLSPARRSQPAAVPAVQNAGEVGLVSVVWGCIAAACLAPTFVINWRAVFPRKAAGLDPVGALRYE